MSGHTFEFSREGGIRALGDSPEDDFKVLPANPDMFRRQDEAVPALPHPSRKPTARAARPVTKPLNVVKAAKARRRELKREIARLRKLEVELAELERLLLAAEQKPCAIVRDIAAKRG